MASRFIDLHQDFGITSLHEDVFSAAQQSSFKALSGFEDVTIYSVVFPLTRKWITPEKIGDKGSKMDFSEYHPEQDNLIREIKFYHSVEREGIARIVRKKSDLDGKGIKMLLALEGADTIFGSEDVHFLRNNDVRSIGFTWNMDTKFAASCMSKKDYGLTGAGENLVEMCNALGLAIDMGHASDRTIMEVSDLSEKPVVVSHTNPKSLHNVKRNIGDDAIEAVTRKGGIIGITSIPFTLGPDPSIDSIVKSMEYVGDNYGWDHVAMGSDFLGITSTSRGFESVEKIHDLGERLGKHADEVLWKNALRVIRENLPQ